MLDNLTDIDDWIDTSSVLYFFCYFIIMVEMNLYAAELGCV